MKHRGIFHAVSIFLLITGALLGGFLLRSSFIRLWESVKQFGLSFYYYFSVILGTSVPDVMKYSSIDLSELLLPEEFLSALKFFFVRFFSLENFRNYFGYLASHSRIIILFFVSLMFLVVLTIPLISIYFSRRNTSHGYLSLPLRAYERVGDVTIQPIRRAVTAYFEFLKAHKPYIYIFVILWILNFNILSPVISLIGYLIYLCSSLDLASIQIIGYNLLVDIVIYLRSVPLPLHFAFAYLIFDRFRKHIGYKRLDHREELNAKFVEDLPICTMIVGAMGTNKTTTMTDIALTKTIEFRNKALDILYQMDMRFPFFPWQVFEDYIKTGIKRHKIFNLATCGKYIERKANAFKRKQTEDNIFGYNFRRYGILYNDNIVIHDIWDTLETYAKAYFIYICESSLLISNYSIREDSLLKDEGNFPIWKTDFFRTSPEKSGEQTKRSHILDFDAVRLGKRLVADNARANFFEFGVVVITEGGKERGNQIENAGINKKDEFANQKNDLFNLWLKMIRHSATVNFYPFVCVLLDEQREMNFGADARELFDIIHIVDKDPPKILMPFFSLGSLLYDMIHKFKKTYYENIRFHTGDNTLFIHFLKWFVSRVERRFDRIRNTFSCQRMNLRRYQSEGDAMTIKAHYYLCRKKIYADRFRTDAFSDYFVKKALLSEVGLNDIPTYRALVAAFDEMRDQHSYFINDLSKVFDEALRKQNKKNVT